MTKNHKENKNQEVKSITVNDLQQELEFMTQSYKDLYSEYKSLTKSTKSNKLGRKQQVLYALQHGPKNISQIVKYICEKYDKIDSRNVSSQICYLKHDDYNIIKLNGINHLITDNYTIEDAIKNK